MAPLTHWYHNIFLQFALPVAAASSRSFPVPWLEAPVTFSVTFSLLTHLVVIFRISAKTQLPKADTNGLAGGGQLGLWMKCHGPYDETEDLLRQLIGFGRQLASVQAVFAGQFRISGTAPETIFEFMRK